MTLPSLRLIQIPTPDSLDPRPYDGKNKGKSGAQGVYLRDRSRRTSANARVSLLPQEEYYCGGNGPENGDADERGEGELCGDRGVEYTGEDGRVRERPSA